MIATCTTCGNFFEAPGAFLWNGHVFFCPNCGHAMVYASDVDEVRDLTQAEIKQNAPLVEQGQKMQDEFCHRKGWWG